MNEYEVDSAKPVHAGEKPEEKGKARDFGKKFVDKFRRHEGKPEEMHANAEERPKNERRDKIEKPKINVEEQVIHLANEGMTASKIGVELKKEFGVNSVKRSTGKTILQILKNNKLSPELPEDLTALLKKAMSLIKHLKSNKQDVAAKRGYLLTVSKIRRLAEYYKRNGILPKDWVYSEEKVAMLMK